MSKPRIKTFHGTNLQLLEDMVNEFCQKRWIYDIQLQVSGGEYTFMVVYMGRDKEV